MALPNTPVNELVPRAQDSRRMYTVPYILFLNNRRLLDEHLAIANKQLESFSNDDGDGNENVT